MSLLVVGSLKTPNYCMLEHMKENYINFKINLIRVDSY